MPGSRWSTFLLEQVESISPPSFYILKKLRKPFPANLLRFYFTKETAKIFVLSEVCAALWCFTRGCAIQIKKIPFFEHFEWCSASPSIAVATAIVIYFLITVTDSLLTYKSINHIFQIISYILFRVHFIDYDPACFLCVLLFPLCREQKKNWKVGKYRQT